MADQQLYRIDRDAVYPNLAGLFRSRVDGDLIPEQWDQLVRVAASLKNRVCPAHVVVQRSAKSSPSDRLAKVLTMLGRVVTLLIKNSRLCYWKTDKSSRAFVKGHL
jgi:TnpA family transposase